MNNRTSTEIAQSAMEEGRTTEDYITSKRARSAVAAIRIMSWKNGWDVMVRQRGVRVYVYRTGESMDDLPPRLIHTQRSTRMTSVYHDFIASTDSVRTIEGNDAQKVVNDYHTLRNINTRRGKLIRVSLRANTIILKRT